MGGATRNGLGALVMRALAAARSTGWRMSFREISAKLEEAGHINDRGQPFNPQSVRAMVTGPQQRASREIVQNSG